MVNTARYRSVASAVEDLLGDDLRVIGLLRRDDDGFDEERVRIRDDVAADYTDDELDAIEDELLFELWYHDYHGELFDTGETRYVLYRYDDAKVVLYHHDEVGVVVSADAGSDVDGESIAATVRDAMLSVY